MWVVVLRLPTPTHHTHTTPYHNAPHHTLNNNKRHRKLCERGRAALRELGTDVEGLKRTIGQFEGLVSMKDGGVL